MESLLGARYNEPWLLGPGNAGGWPMLGMVILQTVCPLHGHLSGASEDAIHGERKLWEYDWTRHQSLKTRS